MSTMQRIGAPAPAPQLRSMAAMLLIGLGLTTGRLEAQEVIPVPFIGNDHLSFYTTELSRDGVTRDRASVFGAVYGHRFGDRAESFELAITARVGARALSGGGDGILDSGVGLAAAKAVAGAERLSVTGSIGLGAMIWGQDPVAAGAPETGRLSIRVPMSTGLSYDLHWGAATVAPFVAVTTSYSSERDYVDDVRTARHGGWRVGTAVGASMRFRELVLSLSELSREHGLPRSSRYVFTAGMSW